MVQEVSREYDVVVVGAGPAGLSAARTMARLGFDTLVVDRLSGPGELSHVCNAIVFSGATVPGEEVLGGLYFPQVDLLIPESLVLARTPLQQCLAPSGQEFQTAFGSGDAPASLIDKAGLLRLLARQAGAAGADFLWGTEVSGLLREGRRVVGVRTAAGGVRASIVLSAEGLARCLCEEAEIYSIAPQGLRQMLVLSQELEAPAAGPEQLGRIVTLGTRYSSAQSGFGVLVMSEPGRATMIFTLLVDELSCATISSSWRYLAEYAHDPRIAGFLAGARVLRRSSFLVPMGGAPASVVRDGLMGVGDAVTPAGFLGIMPAMYVGRQAALVAAEALEEGETSAAALADFDDFFASLILPGLEAEARSMEALLSMTDDEIDRLCHLLNSLHLPAPLFGSLPSVALGTLDWLSRQCTLDVEDTDLLQRFLFGAGDSSLIPALAGSSLTLA